MTVTINPEQRDALYGWIKCELNGLGDVEICLERGDIAEAKRQRGRFARIFTLLDDLGWEPDDHRSSYELQMEQPQLAAMIGHYLAEAEEVPRESSEQLADLRSGKLTADNLPLHGSVDEAVDHLQRFVDQDLDVRSACSAILGQLGEAVTV